MWYTLLKSFRHAISPVPSNVFPILMGRFKHRIKYTYRSLSPKQLSESINGFSRLEISSRDLWNAFSKQLDIQSPFLYPENAVQILKWDV